MGQHTLRTGCRVFVSKAFADDIPDDDDYRAIARELIHSTGTITDISVLHMPANRELYHIEITVQLDERCATLSDPQNDGFTVEGLRPEQLEPLFGTAPLAA